MSGKMTAEEFWEAESGCVHHLAVEMAELEAAAYAAYETWKWSPEGVPEEWLTALKLIAETRLPLFERKAA